MTQDLITLYEGVARPFAAWVKTTFASEETLKEAHTQCFPGIPFDRTDRWSSIMLRKIGEMWKQYGPVVKSSITQHDINGVCRMLSTLLDFNLFTQVYLNLQVCPRYRVPEATVIKNNLTAKWEGTKYPIVKGKLIKTAATIEEHDYNQDLYRFKALDIISKAQGHNSFRVSPIGSTPALIDSNNLSSLGIGGDSFLVVPSGFQAVYLTWEDPPKVIEAVGGNQFRADSVPYTFASKSGGETLNAVLFARFLMFCLYELYEGYQLSFIPRMNSVLAVTDAPVSALKDTEKDGVKLHVGPRPQWEYSGV